MADDITFAQLRTFASAARAGSFAQAADELGISQPAVSEQIRALEQRLGQTLFRRRRGTTPVLTAEGTEALDTAETILAARDTMVRTGGRSVDRVILRISAGPFLRDNYLKALIPRINREHPQVEIDLQPTGSPAAIMQLIEDGALDLATFAIPFGMAAPPRARLICELPLAMIAPAGTKARLAAGECSLEDFQFIFPWRRDVGTRWARQYLRTWGLSQRVRLSFTEFPDAVMQMVEDGHGIGHLMINAVADRIAAGRLERLDLPIPPMRRLVARSPRAPAVALAIENLLCEALAA